MKQMLALAVLLLQAACASTGATFRSGVGDSYVEHPPYYAGASMDVVRRDSGRIGHLPVVFQRTGQPPVFEPRSGAGTAMDTLLAEMNAYIDSLGVSTRFAVASPVSPQRDPRVAPDVRFGCIPEHGAPGNDCAERGDSALGRGPQQMLLAVGRPSPEWTTWIGEVMNEARIARVLVVTVELGDYLMRQQGLVGTKVLELGTGNTARLPWLTSLETPVSVLQLTAALVERDGRAVRIGAEGFYARRTRLLVSAVGGQELLSDADITAARTLRREDLPGSPLAWKVAMRELVGRVSGRQAR